MNVNDWVFDHDTWYQGTPENGSGVFQQSDGKWYGNLVHPDMVNNLLGFGPYETREACIEAIIKEFENIESLRKICQ